MINVYCASAGSGKTHLLTGYYLTLLLRRDWTPADLQRTTEYYEVLAVTFTNKATAEMKERIVAELHKLATEPEKSDYLDQLLDHEEVSQLQQRAQVLLEKMLCDYSNFNVSTIDRFFQKVIRAFMRELDLPSGYEVQLDESLVLDAAVARFLGSLDKNAETEEMSEEYEWVRSYSENNIAEGKEWDVQKAIRTLAKQITIEEYQAYRKSIQALTSDKALLQAYRKQLSQIKETFEKDVRALGENFCAWINAHGLSSLDIFVGKSKGPISNFIKWSKGSTDKYTNPLKKLIEDPSLSLKGGYPKEWDTTEAQEYDAFFQQARALFDEPYILYNSAVSILRNLYQLGTLANVDEAVRQYCSDQSMVLIGNTNALLAKLVEGDDSPFVYAKVGTRYRSFMIDEFQDTSGMQWRNFLPLLQESNASGQRNLIVGDVKQSIYRFRGSDWSLLQSGLFRDFRDHVKNPEQMPAEAYCKLIMDTERLRTNWRSLRGPVWFNNHFFPMAAQQLAWNLGHRVVQKADDKKPAQYEEDPKATSVAKTITDIYADVQQNYKPSKGEQPLAPGLVEIKYLTPQKGEEGEEEYDQCAARHVPDTVKQLIDNGYTLRDIVVLGRKNEQCQAVAEALLKAGYPIISNKALRLDSNDAICAIISIMRHLLHPHDQLLRAIAGFEFYALCDRQGDMGDIINQYFQQAEEDKEGFTLNVEKGANEGQSSQQTHYLFPVLPELANKPLYELLEGLIALLPAAIQQEDAAFLQALRDQVIQFIAQRTPDLSAFLEWWDETGCKSNIATPEGEDAISIMTIHQAKGLGKPAVIYPFATGSLDIEMGERKGNHPSILWCKPKDRRLQVPTPAGQEAITPAFPILRSAKLKDTDFADEYLHERLCCIIDELNTAYVAFTRSQEALILYTQATTLDDNQLYSLQKLLEKFRENINEDIENAQLNYEIEDDCITLGKWQRERRNEKVGDEAKVGNEKAGNEDSEPVAKASNEGSENAGNEDSEPVAKASHEDNEEATKAKQEPALQASHSPLPRLSMRQSRLKTNSPAVKRGNEMHLRLEQIITLQDIHPEDTDLLDLINTDPLTRSWFAEGLTVYNEQPIVLPSGIEKRPDRIIVDAAGRCTVIDYKTSQLEEGQTHKPEHERQVSYYMQLLKTMFREVHGYLWYLSMGTYHEVKPQARKNPVQLTLDWDQQA